MNAALDWEDAWKLALHDLWGRGLSSSEIGRRLTTEFGHVFTKNAVIGKARRMGLDARPSPILNKPEHIVILSPEKTQAIKEMSRLGFGEARIAALHGISRTSVRGALGRKAGSAPEVEKVPVVLRRPPMMGPPIAPRFPTYAHEIRQPVAPPPPRVAQIIPFQPSGGPCCFPIGTPRTKDFRYCDEPSMSGKPYCRPHAKLCYVTRVPKSERDDVVYSRR